MTYSPEIRDKAIEKVKSGKSIRQTAKDMDIPVSTVSYWCEKNNIDSSYDKAEKKVKDEDIVDTIDKNLAMTERELEKELGYSKNGLRTRLIRLIKDKVIDYVIIPGGGNIFKGYIDRRLYYLYKDDLKKWVIKKIPKGLPRSLKNIISQRLHDAGIDISFDTKKKKAIVVDENIYKKLKKKAKTKGVSVIDLIKEI